MKHLSSIPHFLFLFLALGLTACGNKTQAPAPEEGYTVTGTAEGAVDGDTVYLCQMEGFFDMVPVDTTVISQSQFRFTGTADGASLRFVIPTHNGQAVCMSVFVLENADINLTLTPDGQGDKVVGGPSQVLYEEFLDGETNIGQQLQLALDVLRDSTSDETTRMNASLTADSLSRYQHKYRKDFIVSHMPSPASDMLYGLYSNEFTDEEQQELLKLMEQKQPQYPAFKAAMAARRQTQPADSAHQQKP